MNIIIHIYLNSSVFSAIVSLNFTNKNQEEGLLYFAYKYTMYLLFIYTTTIKYICSIIIKRIKKTCYLLYPTLFIDFIFGTFCIVV